MSGNTIITTLHICYKCFLAHKIHCNDIYKLTYVSSVSRHARTRYLPALNTATATVCNGAVSVARVIHANQAPTNYPYIEHNNNDGVCRTGLLKGGGDGGFGLKK